MRHGCRLLLPTHYKKEEIKVAAVTVVPKQRICCKAYDYYKKTITLNYLGEYYFVRKNITSTSTSDEKKLQDLRIIHRPTVIYRPIENWKFVFSSELKYAEASDKLKAIFPNNHFRSIAILTREKILLEKEHGFRLDAGVTRRINDRVAVTTDSFYGNSRAFVMLHKTWMEKFASTFGVEYLNNDPAKGPIADGNWKHALSFKPTITWNITPKLSWLFSDDFTLYNTWKKTDKNFNSHDMNIAYINYAFNDKNSTYFQFGYQTVAAESFPYSIGHTYAFNPKINLTTEVGSNLFKTSDGRDFFAKSLEYPELTFHLNITL